MFVTFALYLALISWIGLRTPAVPSRCNTHQFGPATSALSAWASDMSAWLILGVPAVSFVAGTSIVWVIAGLIAGGYISWMVLAPRLRARIDPKAPPPSLPEFLAREVTGSGERLRSCAALMICVFFIPYTASGLVGAGKLFASIFHLPYAVGVVVTALIITAYTARGGYQAVVATDLLQGGLMLLIVAVFPLYLIMVTGDALGGSAEIWPALAAQPGFLDPRLGPNGTPLSALTLLSSLGWGLGYFGQPHILARYMSLQHPDDAKPAARFALACSTCSLLGSSLVGMMGSVLLRTSFAAQIPSDPEHVFMQLIELTCPPWVIGIMVGGVLAAIMSTADSQVLIAATCIVNDLGPGRHRGTPHRYGQSLAVVAVGFAASAAALSESSAVFQLVALAWSGLGAAFGPLLIFLCAGYQVSERSAIIAMVVGGGGVGLTTLFNASYSVELLPLLPGFFLGALWLMVAVRGSSQSPPSVGDIAPDLGASP